MRRLTRYRYNNIAGDCRRPAPLRHDGGDVWTVSSLPVKADLDNFEARHGLGVLADHRERNGLEVSTIIFVPLARTPMCGPAR